MMNQAQIEKARAQAAKTDMGRARRNGVLAISDTTKGVIELTYENGIYTIQVMATFYQQGSEIVRGKASEVAKVLATLYTVS
jgi:hypothetical protein